MSRRNYQSNTGARCLYASCNTNSRTSNLSLFRVPLSKDRELARQWWLRSKRADLRFEDVKPSHRVCQLHFTADQLETYTYGGVQRLRPVLGAIPMPNNATGKPKSSRSTRTSLAARGPEPESPQLENSSDKFKFMDDGIGLVTKDVGGVYDNQPKRDSVSLEGTQTPRADLYYTPQPTMDHVYSDYNPVEEEEEEEEANACGEDDSDSDYFPEDSPDSDDEDLEDAIPISNADPLEDRKFIVFETCLLQLVSNICCTVCKWASMEEFKLDTQGCNLTVHAKCRTCGEKFTWRSQPYIGLKFAGNVLMVSSIILSGQTYTAIRKTLHLMGVKSISESLFHRYQRCIVVPQIQKAYNEEMDRVTAELNSRGNDISLAGDGRFDSPGHCARYCSYTLIDTQSGLVAQSHSAETELSTSAVSAEKDNFIVCLDAAKSTLPHLKLVTTDGHTGIAKHMRTKEQITHNLDVWHWVKNFRKTLTKDCTNKETRKLLEWIPEIVNHIWWCTQHCQKDADLLVEMVQSVKYHVVNVHQGFDENRKYTRCMHEPIPREIERDVTWLKPNSPAHQLLIKTLTKPHIIRTLKLLTYGQHTGVLESLHNLFLAYAPKRLDFDPGAYKARIQLAILDHNENTGRTTKKDSVGEDLTRLYWSKESKEYRLRQAYQNKTHEFRTNLTKSVLEAAKQRTVILPGDRGIFRGKKQKPAKKDVKHRSRFKQSSSASVSQTNDGG